MTLAFYEQDELRVQLAERMKIDEEGFNPLYNVGDDYKILVWMRTTVQQDYEATWKTFASYISGAMHQYVVGDYYKAALLAVGIIDTGKPENRK